MSPKSLRVGTGLVKSRLIRSGFGLASPSGTVVLFDLYGVQPRIPGPAHALAHAVQRNAAQAVGREAPHEPRAETPVGLEPHAPHGVECLGPVVDGAAVGNPAVAARPTHPPALWSSSPPDPSSPRVRNNDTGQLTQTTSSAMCASWRSRSSLQSGAASTCLASYPCSSFGCPCSSFGCPCCSSASCGLPACSPSTSDLPCPGRADTRNACNVTVAGILQAGHKPALICGLVRYSLCSTTRM